MEDDGTDVDVLGPDMGSGDGDSDSEWPPKLREGGSGASRSPQEAKAITEDDSPKAVIECPVCLQACVHPVQLPCSHIFCFLCVKGVANRSKRCALCRQEIPLAFFHNPKLIRQEELLKTSSFEGGYQWFYEGRNGWWQYDERTSADLEEKFKGNEKSFELLIAGFLYVIDLDSMLQYRRNDPTRRRRIKRDLEDIPEKKGVAGLRTASTPAGSRPGAYGVETSRSSKRQPTQSGDCDQAAGTVFLPVSPPAPSNTPHDSRSPAVPGLSAMMDNLRIDHSGDGSSISSAQSTTQTSHLQVVPRAVSRSPPSPRTRMTSSSRASTAGASSRGQATSHGQTTQLPHGHQRSPRPQRAGAGHPHGDDRARHDLGAASQPVRRSRSSSSLYNPSESQTRVSDHPTQHGGRRRPDRDHRST